jgi:hypothetical protein
MYQGTGLVGHPHLFLYLQTPEVYYENSSFTVTAASLGNSCRVGAELAAITTLRTVHSDSVTYDTYHTHANTYTSESSSTIKLSTYGSLMCNI